MIVSFIDGRSKTGHESYLRSQPCREAWLSKKIVKKQKSFGSNNIDQLETSNSFENLRHYRADFIFVDTMFIT